MGTSSISGDETIIFADNASFDGTERGGKMTTDGQLWIGSTASPHIRKATLTAGSGISITNGSGSITIAANSAVLGETITGDSGGALSPSVGNWNILGGSSGVNIVTTGSGSTLTIRSDILTYVQPGAYPFNASNTDYFISVDTTIARTVNLPNSPSTRKSYIIKDRTGNAAAANISVTTPGGAVNIDAATTYTINSNYGSIQVIFNGTSYEVF